MKAVWKLHGLSIILVFFSGIGIGCSSIGTSSPSRVTVPPYFEEVSPGVLKSYTGFFVQPIELYGVDGDALRRVDDNDTRKLADDFRRKLIKSLGNKHATIPSASRSVALLEINIADVSSTYTAFQLLPGVLMPNVMRGGASIEARFIDSVSRKQVALFKESRQGEREGFLSGLGKWDGAEKAFDEWARLLGKHVNRF
jgi:hypothetical protein